ncbi:MAG: FG-GAP repeat protein, partial [Candidatus Saganbacteria bacterium]|nr:FG-GAP repeat protein [Candidatus Saganbacteria bacterium]
DDILIGAVDNDDGAPDGGKAYLIYGSAYSLYGEIDLGTADASFVGENQEDNIGMTLSGAGDVNGDSYADILLGSHGTYDAYLFYGPVYGEWDATAADAVFRYLPGGLVSEAGDVNGDGYDDILIGAPSVPSTDEGDGVIAIGKAYLFNGPVYGEIDSSMAEAIFNGINNHDGAGYAVSGAGDVNSDGYADILIGTHGAEEAYVVFGPVSGTIDLSLADASFSGLGIHTPHTGSSVSDAGDVNSDGYADILIGAYDFEAGKTYLMYGPFSGNVTLVPSAVDAMFIGENDEDCAGYSISGVGDVDGDGYDDVLIGAPVNDGGGDNRGQSYLFYGNVCP